jgi:hypothetical protein
MPPQGQAAMLLLFDVAAEAIAEHDEWHTHEHLPERLAIPGFIRGTRWVAANGKPRYFVMYEVEALATLTSGAYLERLNHPSPWTARMMPHYRGMIRGFCSVSGSFGCGAGHAGLLIRLSPAGDDASSLRDWLLLEVLSQLPARRGIGSARLLERAATPAMTREQRMRGADAGIDWTLLVTGYDEDAVTELRRTDLDSTRLEAHGATGIQGGTYRMEYSIIDRDAKH